MMCRCDAEGWDSWDAETAETVEEEGEGNRPTAISS